MSEVFKNPDPSLSFVQEWYNKLTKPQCTEGSLT